jgi:hypothetical protein
MQLDKTIKQKRSLGAFRKANKTKPKSPDLTGQMKLQRHTAAKIVEQFSHDETEEVVCNIAGWKNQDYNGGLYLTVELSPRFASRTQVDQDDIIDSVINGKEGDIEDI